jgi:peptide deformylase
MNDDSRILLWPNPTLNKVSEPMTEPDLALAERMLQAMRRAGGVGLSAVQIGVLKRLVVLNVGEGAEIYYNPTIVSTGTGGSKKGEGCLSLPKFFAQVYRPNTAIVEHGFGERVQIPVTGLRCQAMLHECEHLDGKIFVQNLTSAEKSLAMGHMQKLRRQGINRDLFS